MQVRFWGTRGSIATPGPQTAKFGGNTSCIEVRTEDGSILILDCGTGARELGLRLMGERPIRAHVLITHTHWDHIQGFPFFAPAFLPDSEINVYAPTGFLHTLEQALSGQMQYSYFPVKLGDLRSQIRFMNVEEGAFRIGNTTVETQYPNHTAPTIGYRINSGGTTLVYSTDHEPFGINKSALAHPGDRRHIDFLDQADLVIHDAQYSQEEYPSKLGWGHSTVDYATDVAMEANAKRLVLFHHEPTHDDAMIQRLEAASRTHVAARRSNLEVVAAAEGMELSLPAKKGALVELGARSALDVRTVAGARVLIASMDPDTAEQIVGVMVHEGIEAIVVTDKTAVLEQARQLQPSVAILDDSLFDHDLFAVAAAASGDFCTARMALIVLSATLDEDLIRCYLAVEVTDCLVKPFGPPMLHARVRTWLTRSDADARSGLLQSPSPSMTVVSSSGRPREARKADILAATHLFGALEPLEIQRLAARARVFDFPEGATLTRQGDKSGAVFVIDAGRVRVVARTPDVRAGEILLGELGPGDIIGELSLLDDLPHSATVVAVSRTRCLALQRRDFLVIQNQNPTFSLRLLRMLSHRLREADRLLARSGSGALTGLATRRTLEASYRREVAAARRRSYSIALLFVDIDQLGAVNDGYGYTTGDQLLQVVADALRTAVRESDIVARSGSDEFIALMPDAAADEARLAAARVYQNVAELVAQREIPAKVTCSVRLAASADPPNTLEELLAEAERAERMGPGGSQRGA